MITGDNIRDVWVRLLSSCKWTPLLPLLCRDGVRGTNCLSNVNLQILSGKSAASISSQSVFMSLFVRPCLPCPESGGREKCAI